MVAIVPSARKRWSKAVRAQILNDHGCTCYLCGEAISDGETFDLDHEIALDLGGKDEIENLKPAHQSCHRSKTAREAKLFAKGRRIRAKLNPETRKRSKRPIQSKTAWPKGRKIQSRGFRA